METQETLLTVEAVAPVKPTKHLTLEQKAVISAGVKAANAEKLRLAALGETYVPKSKRKATPSTEPRVSTLKGIKLTDEQKAIRKAKRDATFQAKVAKAAAELVHQE